MNDLAAAVASLLTPSEAGAIATVGVRGPRATLIIDSLFTTQSGRPMSAMVQNRVVLGRWSTGEELIVCRRSCDTFEVHCHGGKAAARAILVSLQDHGCQVVPWQAWLAGGSADALTVEATAALAKAPTTRTAAILLDQHGGALRAALDQILAHLAAGDVEPASQFVEHASQMVDALRALRPLGRHLTRPWKVVLAGRPNVGKSSLLNALVGFRRAIVHGTPGTTRDIVTSITAMDGWPVELSDTAGLRQGGDEVEAAGIEQARGRLAEADLVVWVSDVTMPPVEAEQALDAATVPALTKGAAAATVLFVDNKCDLPHRRAAGAPRLEVSALTGQGLDEMQQAIAERLVPFDPKPGQAVAFECRHFELLDRAAQLIAKRELNAARAALASLFDGAVPGKQTQGVALG